MIRVGTSGWSYDDWVGPVYPKHLRNRRGEWLGHYALALSTVEVNSTFYQLPMAETVEGWVEKAADLDGFEYSLKVPRKVTHRAMVDGDVDATRNGLAEFAERTRPLREADRQGAILVQLSPHLHGGPGEVEVLDAALEMLDGLGDVAVELRHRTWVQDDALREPARDVLEARGASICVVDGPSFPTIAEPTADHAYVRFHGRRSDVWFESSDLGDHVRYDYLYDEDELRPWAERLRDLDGDHDRVRAYFNNHPDGQAFANAEQLRDMLGLDRPKREGSGQRTLDGF